MNKQAEQQEGSRKANPYFLAIIGILVIVLGLKFYFDYQEKQEMETYYTAELESVEIKLEKISVELDEKITELDSLGGTVEDLIAAKTEIENEINQLRFTRKANRQLISRLRAKTEGYVELLKAKDIEIEHLKALNEQLLVENVDLKTEKNELNRSLNELYESNEQLENKVAIASRLIAENIKVYAIAKSGKQREGKFRKKQISQLKIEFNIANNDVAPIESKDIMIRIIDPNGQVIFDVAKGSGTFMLNSKEEFYTSLQSMVFDNSEQQLTYAYDKGSQYATGEYKVEILTDGYFMGSENFTVR